MTRALPALVALVLLLLPAAAPAQGPATNAPPGNSAIEQYLETVPGAAGSRRPRPPAAGAGALTAAERLRLERLGADGRTLADAVDATAPATPRKRATPMPSVEGRPPLGEVVDAVTGRDGDGGMGALLPAILIASLLGIVTLAVLRRRSAS